MSLVFLGNWSEEAKETINNMSSVEKDRLYSILAMQQLVESMNDESAYMAWISLVPDGATEDDFIDFAINDDGTKENQLFDEAVVLFKSLWERYAAKNKGLYIGHKTY